MTPARATGCLLIGLALPLTARAQPPPVVFAPETRPGFISRFSALVSIEHLGEREADFLWDADVALGLDVVDFGHGRIALGFNYEAVLGDELQPFDPRYANYTIDTLGTVRRGGLEVGALLHHVSRHLSDRSKDFGIAWNDLGVVLAYARRDGPWLWQARGTALKTVARSFVDYDSDLGVTLGVRRRLGGPVSLIGSAGGHARQVTGRRGRERQIGGRSELGFRVEGREGAVEIVAGVEERVDADPFELAPRRWFFLGARFATP
jgi:hypothetical protein